MGKNTILLCACDAGGARNLLPLVDLIKLKGYNCIFTGSEFSRRFFADKDIEINKRSIESYEDALKYIDMENPSAVICGTTRYVEADRYITLAARAKSIRSVVVLDEWYNYHRRFQGENGELTYLPDVVCCQDELARREAEEEGIPASRLQITGSPSLSSLADKVERFSIDEPRKPDYLNSNTKQIVLSFISENYAATMGSALGESGPLGSYLGYTEISVGKDLIDVLKKMDKEMIYVEKLHPCTDGPDLQIKHIGKVKIVKVKHIDLWVLLWHSDLVVGMRSMALLESAIMGVLTVSYQPGLIGPQMCTAVRLGLVKNLSTKSDLERWCREIIKESREQMMERVTNRYPFASESAAENVLNLAIE